MGRLRWINALKVLCIVVLFVPLLTGCWDRLEIEERAVVLGIGIDAVGPEAAREDRDISHRTGEMPTRDMIHVTVQIALPGRIPLGPGEGGGGGGGGGKEQGTVWVLDVVGHSIDDALMNLDQKISGKLFFGHLRVIVISEEMARRGLSNLNDYLRRNSEVRRMAWMFVCKGKAKDLMMAVPKLERVPSLYLSSTLDGAVKIGKLPADYVGMYWSKSSKKGQEGILPYVSLMKDDAVEISGLAYFRGERMVGVTRPYEIVAYMGIKGINPGGYRGLMLLDGFEKTVTVYSTHRKSKIQVDVGGGRPHVKVTVFLELNMEEKLSKQFKVNNTEASKDIQNRVEKSLLKTYRDVISKTQSQGSDIFGFGEYFRAREPAFWNREIVTKERWQEVYRTLDIDMDVSTRMRRIGMKAR